MWICAAEGCCGAEGSEMMGYGLTALQRKNRKAAAEELEKKGGKLEDYPWPEDVGTDEELAELEHGDGPLCSCWKTGDGPIEKGGMLELLNTAIVLLIVDTILDQHA